MKPKFIKLSAVLSTFLFAFVLMPALTQAAGHVQPAGTTVKQASQLVIWYDEVFNEGDNFGLRGSVARLQITNGSLDTSVNVHVQIFSDDAEDPLNFLCREHDFNDTFTPTDTHVYELGQFIEDDATDDDDDDGDPTDSDELPSFANNGTSIPIDLRLTRGFIVITPVDTVTLPRQAISHNHLFASITISHQANVRSRSIPSMGRLAVDFATGVPLADGVLLDGVNNGFVKLQPSQLSFAFHDEALNNGGSDNANLVSIAFSDTYFDPSNEYRAEPATVVWDTIMYDQIENGVSCQQHINTCFVYLGINDDFNAIVDNNTSYADLDLCPAVSNPFILFQGGWAKIEISSLSDNDNALGIVAREGGPGALSSWMLAE